MQAASSTVIENSEKRTLADCALIFLIIMPIVGLVVDKKIYNYIMLSAYKFRRGVKLI